MLLLRMKYNLKKHYKVRVLYFENVTNYFKQMFYFILNKNIGSAKILRTTIEEFNPDLVYVHNTWFKASVSIFSILKNKVPTLIKLHITLDMTVQGQFL